MKRTYAPFKLALVSLLSLCNCDDVVDLCIEPGGGDFVEACSEGADPVMLGEHHAQPLARSGYHALPFALDDLHVYWAACSGDILQTLKGGGVTSVLIPAQGCTIGGLAVDGQRLFVARSCGGGLQQSAELLAYTKSGQDGQLLAQQAGAAGPLVLTAERLFWTTRVREDSSSLWSMVDLPGTQAELVASVESPYLPFTVDAENLYWVAGRELMRRPLEGGSASELAVLDDAVESFVMGGQQPRWISLPPEGSDSERELWHLPSTDAETPTRVFDAPVTRWLASDGKALFGAGHLETDGVVSLRLYRFASADGKPSPIAAPLHWPEAIALEAGHVYWVDAPTACESTRLMRVNR
jgi:hypothetical protein